MDEPLGGGDFIARKLDRCLQNECCLDVFPNVLTEVLQPGLSDHCPMVINLNFRPDSGRRKLYPFKFFNFWADHPFIRPDAGCGMLMYLENPCID